MDISPSTSSTKNNSTNRSKSCDTVCTSNSSCIMQKKKTTSPLAYSLRSSGSRTNTNNNSVKQRVLSAKLLKLRSVQSQLNDAKYHVSELTRENQLVKGLLRRQTKELSKFDDTNAELPRLLHSHEEEIRILRETNKALKKKLKESNDLLKNKEEDLLSAREQLKHLEKLTKDKRLVEREKLLEEIDQLKFKLQKSDEQVALLNRKLILESKSAKQRFNAEASKHKQCQRDLNQSLIQIENLTTLLEAKEHPKNTRFSRFNIRSSANQAKPHHEEKTPVSEIRLEPINRNKVLEPANPKPNGVLKPPSESIQRRLSPGYTESKDSQSTPSSANSTTSCKSTRPNSTQKLEKITTNLELAINKTTDSDLNGYCNEIITNVKNCSSILEEHQNSLKASQDQTQTLLEVFNDTRNLEDELKKKLDLASRNSKRLDFVNDILNDENQFQGADTNGKTVAKKEHHVKMEEKKKLLAALKAIDNGDSMESVESTNGGLEQQQKTNGLMTELFGEH